MVGASVNSIETLGLVDGPGIRCVVFLNGCKLRCKYCHNPESWKISSPNMTVDEVLSKIKRCKPYFKRNNGGVTFSGGEPLLQKDFLIEICRRLKRENIHIALDTAGVGIGDYDKILENIDLVLLDIKHIDVDKYLELSGLPMDEFNKFVDSLNNSNAKVWIRQVIIPGYNDNYEYMADLKQFIKKINNIEKVEFLPYHTMGVSKYEKLGLKYPLIGLNDMNKDRCDELYNYFNNI